jgi:hypothetical protein
MVNVSENCYSTGSTFTSNALAASLQQAPGEAPGPYAPPGASTVRRRRRRDNDPAFTTTRRAVVEVPRHLRGKQPATCSARSAMKRFRQVIGLMHVTPYRSPPARPAQVHGVVDTATRAPDASRDRRLRLLCRNSRRQRRNRMAHVPGNSSAPLLVELHFIVQPFDWFVQKQQSGRLLIV